MTTYLFYLFKTSEYQRARLPTHAYDIFPAFETGASKQVGVSHPIPHHLAVDENAEGIQRGQATNLPSHLIDYALIKLRILGLPFQFAGLPYCC
jgi:hypothetical protein